MQKRGERELQRLRRVEKVLGDRIDELTALYEVSRSITSATNLDRMLNLITKKVAVLIKSDICMIHLLDKGVLRLKTVYGMIKRGAPGLEETISMKRCLIAQTIKIKRPVRINNLHNYKNDALCNVCRSESLHSLLAAPLIEKGNCIGILTICNKRPSAYSKADEEELELFASQAAVAIENARLFEETKANYLNTMKLLASVIDAKDTYTEDHSERVVRSALAIANTLGLSDRQKFVIRYASLLHDIGKIGIDISILRKPAPLTREEWLEIRSHPKAGADIVKKAGFLDDLIPAILYHHVKYSGGGYPPTKMKRDGIPIEARILAVADAYEAMRSDRPYRKRLPKREAIAELKKGSGTQFDPRVVRAFLKYLG